ncbi:hypothetical protein K505DRAFT_412748 [Melanomma pulvis-pyrius CBS 109.77]|uniref:Protein kinase domain-containing protein n=1 Tax=Melanomma pulvis-pyrius CBS 109.77 TaxID=1314802 RepID=A0A6A6XYL7_9PLEO|nr:hypothetical protein K505DRAFT_412748 [Melanomma pulvis-pyrius CBS 109.77]
MQMDALGIQRVDSVDKAMFAWFAPSSTPVASRRPFGETDLRGISDILRRTGRDSWSRIPRIYATLRIINQLPAIDDFLTQGLSDVWFPFSHKSLPASLKSQAARCDFLEAQSLVLSKGLDLEKEDGKHRHFSNPAEIPFQKVAELGKGGYSYVDRVLSTISYTEYARKLIPRGRTFRKDQKVLRDFEKELGMLKKLSHIHIVELVGSYTDPRYVGIIMSPVADYNLKEFLDLDPLPPESHSLLRTFFGCLTAALKYLHENRIRHKDIKPQNVLVKGHQVLLTDFGISCDWSELGHSTTTGPTSMTPRYSAPEVAAHEPRNSSADIWSLGCVFLELWSVLCGKTTSNLTKYMTTSGSCSHFYYQNLDGIASWCNMIRPKPEEGQHLEQPYFWIFSMLEVKSRDRCNVHNLFDRIQEANADLNIPVTFIGTCCAEEEHSAESVQSIFEDDITETTNLSSTMVSPEVSTLGILVNPTIQPISCPDTATALDMESLPNHRASKRETRDRTARTSATEPLTRDSGKKLELEEASQEERFAKIAAEASPAILQAERVEKPQSREVSTPSETGPKDLNSSIQITRSLSAVQTILSQVVKGDPEGPIGHAVDHNGDMLNKRGNFVGQVAPSKADSEPELEAFKREPTPLIPEQVRQYSETNSKPQTPRNSENTQYSDPRLAPTENQQINLEPQLVSLQLTRPYRDLDHPHANNPKSLSAALSNQRKDKRNKTYSTKEEDTNNDLPNNLLPLPLINLTNAKEWQEWDEFSRLLHTEASTRKEPTHETIENAQEAISVYEDFHTLDGTSYGAQITPLRLSHQQAKLGMNTLANLALMHHRQQARLKLVPNLLQRHVENIRPGRITRQHSNPSEGKLSREEERLNKQDTSLLPDVSNKFQERQEIESRRTHESNSSNIVKAPIGRKETMEVEEPALSYPVDIENYYPYSKGYRDIPRFSLPATKREPNETLQKKEQRLRKRYSAINPETNRSTEDIVLREANRLTELANRLRKDNRPREANCHIDKANRLREEAYRLREPIRIEPHPLIVRSLEQLTLSKDNGERPSPKSTHLKSMLFGPAYDVDREHARLSGGPKSKVMDFFKRMGAQRG